MPIDQVQRQNIRERVQGWLVHTNVAGSLKLTNELVDAITAGVQAASTDCVGEGEKRHWERAREWFEERRI